MVEPDFAAAGVRIRQALRSLTRAGQVLVRDGKLTLTTSYGSEIDSGPLEQVRVSGYAGRHRALASIGGTRYVLELDFEHREGLLNAVRTARAKAAAERGLLGR